MGALALVWILGVYYFLLFAYLGAMMPWFPPLLEARGFDERQIGLALLAVQLPRALLPPAWGFVADRLAEPRRILVLTSILAGGAFLVLGGSPAVPFVFVLLVVHGFFLVPLFPLAETLTFQALGPAERHRYGRVRVWGSVGFIVASLGLGQVVGVFSVHVVPWVTGAFLVAGGLLAMGIPRRESSKPRRRAEASAPFPWRRFVPLLTAALMGQASHGAYYAFFSIQLQREGYSTLVIGSLWALAVAAEIALMSFSPRVLGGLGLRGALIWALGLSALRWALTAAGPPLALLALVQTLHAASFALLHIATVQLADRFAPVGHKALGQSLLSTFAYGMGLGLGTAFAGIFAESLDFAGLYVASALVALAGLLAALLVRE